MEEPLASTSALCPDCPSSSFVGWECAAECAVMEDCQECYDGESGLMECCEDFDCLLPSPALSAARTPKNSQGPYRPIDTVQYPNGLALECNECLETAQPKPPAPPFRTSGTVTPVDVVGAMTPPITGLGELLGALNGSVIEEIVSRSFRCVYSADSMTMCTAQLLLLWTGIGIATSYARLLSCPAPADPSASALPGHAAGTRPLFSPRPSDRTPAPADARLATAIPLQMAGLRPLFPRPAILHHPRQPRPSLPPAVPHSDLPGLRSRFSPICHRIDRGGKMPLGRLYDFAIPSPAPATSPLDARLRLASFVNFDQSRILPRYRSVQLLWRGIRSPAFPSHSATTATAHRRTSRTITREPVGSAVEAFIGGAFRRTGSSRRFSGATPEAACYRYRSTARRSQTDRSGNKRKRESATSTPSHSHRCHPRSSVRCSSHQIDSTAQPRFRRFSTPQYERYRADADGGRGSRGTDAGLQMEALREDFPHDVGIDESSIDGACWQWEASVFVLLGRLRSMR